MNNYFQLAIMVSKEFKVHYYRCNCDGGKGKKLCHCNLKDEIETQFLDVISKEFQIHYYRCNCDGGKGENLCHCNLKD